jgi:hypothetical protein
MDRLLNVIAGMSVLLLIGVLISVRRAHIRVEYSVSWMGAAVLVLALSRWRAVQEWLATAMGFQNPTYAVLTVAGAIFLVVLYRSSLVMSELRDSNIALTQKLAMLEFRIDSMQNQAKHEEA